MLKEDFLNKEASYNTLLSQLLISDNKMFYIINKIKIKMLKIYWNFWIILLYFLVCCSLDDRTLLLCC